MSFRLNGVYMSDSLLRSYLLGRANPSEVIKYTQGNGDGASSPLIRKLNVVIPEVYPDTFVKKFMDRVNENNIDQLSSVLLLNKSHLLALMYLSYDNRLSNDTLSQVLNSNNDRNRTEILLSLLDEKETERIDIFGPLITLLNSLPRVNNYGEPSTLGKKPNDIIQELTNSRKEIELKPGLSTINFGNYFYKLDSNIPFKYCGKWGINKYAYNTSDSTLTFTPIDSMNLSRSSPGSLAVFQQTGSLASRVPRISGWDSFWESWGKALLFGGGYATVVAMWRADLLANIVFNVPIDKYFEEYKLGVSIGEWWYDEKIQSKFDKYKFELRYDRIIADAFSISLIDYVSDRYKKRSEFVDVTKPNYEEIVMRSAVPHVRAAIGNVAKSFEYGDNNIWTGHEYSENESEKGTYNVYTKILNEVNSDNTVVNRSTYTAYNDLIENDSSGYKYGDLISNSNSKNVEFGYKGDTTPELKLTQSSLNNVEAKNLATVLNIFSSVTNRVFSTTNDSGNKLKQEIFFDSDIFLDNYNFMTRLIGSHRSSGKSDIIKDYGDLIDFDILLISSFIENFGTVDFGNTILKIIKKFSSNINITDDATSRFINLADLDNNNAKTMIQNYLKIFSGVTKENKSYIIDTNSSNIDIIKEYFAIRVITNYLSYLADDEKDVDALKESVMSITALDEEIYHLLYIIRHCIIDAKTIRNELLSNSIVTSLKEDPTGTNASIRSLYKNITSILLRNSSFMYGLYTNNQSSPDSFGATEGDSKFLRILSMIFLGEVGTLTIDAGRNRLQKITDLETTYRDLD